MSEILLEADFIAADIKSIINKNKQIANTGAEQVQQQPKPKNFDWEKELKARLEANKKLGPDARKTEAEIEATFFEEYFSEKWDKEIANQLLSLGAPLTKAIKVIGFNEKINPILGFINNKYTQDRLLRTKLLNFSTFKAIFNAVAKKLVADTEFFKANDYNIIYCTDLYKKTSEEIEKYLVLQKSVLPTAVNVYTPEDRLNNKKVFFQIPQIKEQDETKRVAAVKAWPEGKKVPSAKSADTLMNSYNVAKALGSSISKFNTSVEQEDADNNEKKANLVAELKTPAEVFAAIQYLSMSTNSKEAKAALSYNAFSKLTFDEIRQATSKIIDKLPKGTLTSNEVTALIKALLSKLEAR